LVERQQKWRRALDDDDDEMTEAPALSNHPYNDFMISGLSE
jgi:hypothetical protein